VPILNFTTTGPIDHPQDPIIRYGGVYTLALAYAGTANKEALRKLLHIAVSDTSNDVRRAAVTSLAFLMFKTPAQVPRMVQLLSESYNPHVRLVFLICFSRAEG
jgi:26S proteasome regulatory subunit N2